MRLVGPLLRRTEAHKHRPGIAIASVARSAAPSLVTTCDTSGNRCSTFSTLVEIDLIGSDTDQLPGLYEEFQLVEARHELGAEQRDGPSADRDDGERDEQGPPTMVHGV